MNVRTGVAWGRNALVAFALLALFALGASTTASAASGPFSGKNGKIAVVKSGGGPMRVGVVSRKGNFRPLYEASSDDFVDTVSFSPSGSRIAFSSGFQPTGLGILKVSGGRPSWISPGNMNVYNPTWIKGGRIVYHGDYMSGGSRAGAYSIRDNGNDVRRLFRRSEVVSTAPGGRAFAAVDIRGNSRYLDLLDRRGKKITRLASDRKNRFFYMDPAFSDDGRWVVYTRVPGDPSGDYRGSLFMVRRDGTGTRRLTKGNRDANPSFSPDGRWISFLRRKKGSSYESNLSVLPLRHPKKVRRVTRTPNAQYFDTSWGRR